MRLARVPLTVEEAAQRLAKLDKSRTVHNQNSLHVALAGGLGARIRNQAVEVLNNVLEAVLGRPPTMTELFGDRDGGDAA